MSEEATSGETAVAALRHDLRTPLNQIIGYSELVAEDLEGDAHTRTREDLEKIGRAARGLADLITREIQPGRIMLVGERTETTGGGDAAATDGGRGMLMAAAAAGPAAFVVRLGVVDVAVGEFFGRGGTDVADGDVEGQGFSGEGMVGVDGDGVTFDGDDHDVVGPVLAGGLEAHAGFDVGPGGEDGALDLTQAAFVAEAVGFDGRDSNGQLLAGRLAFEGFFEPGNNTAVTVDVGHGLPAFLRAIEGFGAAIADFVVEENNVVFGDFHAVLL